jgi:Pyruvate/2-oxoacid:ferredoxin oxidoreductase gamma subunit
LPVDEEYLLSAVRDRVPQKAVNVNLRAFELGRGAMTELIDAKKLREAADCTGVS